MTTPDSSPGSGFSSARQAKSPDPGPHAFQDPPENAERNRYSRSNGNAEKAKRERTPRVVESCRTDRRQVPPEARSLLSIAKEGRLSLFSAHDLLTIWAAATGTSWRSGDDHLKTVRCADIYVACGRNGSGRMTIHWDVSAGLISCEHPTIWAMAALTTLANMVLPDRLLNAAEYMEKTDMLTCYGHERHSRSEIEGLTDTRSDSPYNATLRSLSDEMATSITARNLSVDALREARRRHGLDKCRFTFDLFGSRWVINNDQGLIDSRRIDAFLRDSSAVKAADHYLACDDASDKAGRKLSHFRETHAPRKITGLGPDEFERWPSPDEWGTHATREVAKALYRMTSIRRIELDRLASEFADDLDGMIKWRFSATINDTIRDIQQVLLKTGVEIS